MRSVVMVDQAGQIGARQLLDLISLAHSRGCRVILSRDTRQHGTMEASNVGDGIQTKANSIIGDGRTVTNREIVTVSKIKRTGEIIIRAGRKLPEGYRQFFRSYAFTLSGSKDNRRSRAAGRLRQSSRN
jgi:hypothetical protein